MRLIQSRTGLVFIYYGDCAFVSTIVLDFINDNTILMDEKKGQRPQEHHPDLKESQQIMGYQSHRLPSNLGERRNLLAAQEGQVS